MSDLDTELAGIFHDEATQRLDQMDAVLLEIESGKAGPGGVDSLFRDAHTIKGAAGMLGLDDIRTLAHAAEGVLGRIRGAGSFPPGLAALLLRCTAALRAMVNGSAGQPVDDLLRELTAAGSPAAVPPPGEPPPAAEPSAAEPAEPPPGRSPAAQPPGAAAKTGTQPTLRVPAAKIDHLIDVTGEITQYRHRLEHLMGRQARLPPEMAEIVSRGGRMLDDLKDTAVGMRTLPLAVITASLPRAVRDMAHAAGKEADFVVAGAGTEIDRVILESLSEPVTHLLRNAVGHGIEPPAERERAAKPARGRIELRAVPRGRMVEIVVADDGRGVAPAAIEEARREGSLAAVLTRPGYSTAAGVSDLAGRGVGLDVVKDYVASLGGSLEVRSEPGRGTQVALLLPLALALTEVLLFERGPAAFGLPLAAVEEVVMVAKTMMLQGRPALDVRGKSLPVADVAAVIGAQAPPPRDRPPAIVASVGGRRAVVTCDALAGTEEVVVKPLGLAAGPGYLGAAILGDGRIALLIEPAALVRRALHGRGQATPAAGPGPAQAPRVLVVEDSFTVRELQRSILEAAGYPVATARDGRDALGVIARDPRIALVITDAEMPELDGIGLTRAIRADPARSSLPVVIVTARGTEAGRREGIEAGADAYMTKWSFDQQTLLATVERLVGR